MSSDITLDLDALGNPNSVHYDNFFYQTNVNFLFLRLYEHAHEAKDLLACCSKPQNDHFDAITLVGDRGAGKTTFLKTICAISHTPEQLDKVKLRMATDHPNIDTSTHILFLDILDPSILENCEIFLAIIVASITHAVENKTHDCHRTNDLKNFRKVKLKLSKMFRVLFHESAKDRWADMDDELLSQELSNFTSQGLMIGKTFNEFVCEALHILKKDLLVLPIDDADTKFNKGHEILETVRKYLTTPFLIPIVSCDLKLFELVLKNKFYADSSHLSKTPDKDSYHAEINILSMQYLEKVLNPCDRINLYPISDYLTVYDCHEINVKYHQTEIKIREVYKDFFNYAFHQKTDILNPSLNSLAHIIPTNNRLLINSLKSTINLNDAMKSNNNAQMLHNFFNAYSYYLNKYDLSSRDLFLLNKNNYEHNIASLILTKIQLVEFGRLDARYNTIHNKTENIVALLLKMVLTITYHHNMSRFLDYMLLIQEVTFSLHQRLSKVGDRHTLPFQSNEDIIAHYISETQLQMNIPTRDRMSRHILYLYNHKFFPDNDFKNNIGNGWQIVNPEYLSVLNEHKNNTHLAIQHSISIQNIGPKKLMINPYRFLGAISDILKILSNHQGENLKTKLFSYLHNSRQLRYFDVDTENDIAHSMTESSLPEITLERLNDLIIQIIAWKKSYFEVFKLNDDLGILTHSMLHYRRNIEHPKFKNKFKISRQTNNLLFPYKNNKINTYHIKKFINNKLLDGWDKFHELDKDDICDLLVKHINGTLKIITDSDFQVPSNNGYENNIIHTLKKSLKEKLPEHKTEKLLKFIENMFYAYTDIKYKGKSYLTHTIYLFLFALYKEEATREKATSSKEYATEFTLDKEDNAEQYRNKDVNDLYHWVKNKGKRKTYRLSYMLARFPLMDIGFDLKQPAKK